MGFQRSVDRLAPGASEQGGAQNRSEGELDVGGAVHLRRVAVVCVTAGLSDGVRRTQDAARDGAVTLSPLYTALKVEAQKASNSCET